MVSPGKRAGWQRHYNLLVFVGFIAWQFLLKQPGSAKPRGVMAAVHAHAVLCALGGSPTPCCPNGEPPVRFAGTARATPVTGTIREDDDGFHRLVWQPGTNPGVGIRCRDLFDQNHGSAENLRHSLRISVMIGSAMFSHQYGTLLLHMFLLPMNSYRLYQMLKLIKGVKSSCTKTSTWTG